MTIPRPWGNIEYQRSPQQQNDYAKPSGTDALQNRRLPRFPCLVHDLLLLQHSIHYYKPRNRGLWNSFTGFLHWAPTKFLLIIPLTAVRVGYDIAASFEWNISPLKYNVNAGWMYGLGYAPAFLSYLSSASGATLTRMRPRPPQAASRTGPHNRCRARPQQETQLVEQAAWR
jgi:hypothetical protein